MLIDVVVVDEQRVNVPKVDVEGRRNLGARRRDINKKICYCQLPLPEHQCKYASFLPFAPDRDRPSQEFPLPCVTLPQNADGVLKQVNHEIVISQAAVRTEEILRQTGRINTHMLPYHNIYPIRELILPQI